MIRTSDMVNTVDPSADAAFQDEARRRVLILWRHVLPGSEVGRFQWHTNVVLGGEEQGHFGDRPSDGEVPHKCLDDGATDIRGRGQRVFASQQVFLCSDLIENCSVDAVRIARARRMNVDKQQVNAAVEGCNRLVQERSDGVAVRFVPGGNDLDHRHDAVVARMPDYDSSLQTRIGIARDRRSSLDDRRRISQCRRAGQGHLRRPDPHRLPGGSARRAHRYRR